VKRITEQGCPRQKKIPELKKKKRLKANGLGCGLSGTVLVWQACRDLCPIPSMRERERENHQTTKIINERRENKQRTYKTTRKY
jgi:hypothetical protein